MIEPNPAYLNASKVVRGIELITIQAELTKMQGGLRRSCLRLAACVLLVGVAAAPLAQAKDKEKKKREAEAAVSYTPMALDNGYGPMDITAPPIPVEEIIKKFTAKETVFREALSHYTYRRAVRVQTIDDDNKVDGEYFQVDDVTFDGSGKRTERVVLAPASSLQRISMSPADFQDIQERLPYVLTTENTPQYDINYVGRQKVDDVQCYVFEVGPKVMEKGKRYFKGKIWVDSEAMQIVVTSGKNVPDDLRKGHEDLSTPFTTYREQVDGENWFPTYTKGDGVLHFTGGNGYMGQDVRIRQTIKYTDYKQFGTTTKILYDGQEVENEQDKGTDPKKPGAAKPDKPK